MKTSGENKYLRCILALSLCFGLVTSAVVRAQANALQSEVGALPQEVAAVEAVRANELNVKVNGRPFEGKYFLHNNTTYVAIRQFSEAMGSGEVSWNQQTRTATVKGDGVDISVKGGANYMMANGRALWLEYGSIIDNGIMYVPIRAVGAALGCNISWEGSTKTASADKSGEIIESGESYYDSDSVKWLARIIHAEAEGESLQGKIAVGNVVLNRVESSLFPNTIYGVIFDKNNGVQFTPTVNGSIYNEPSEDSIIAAKLCLEGVNILPDALFFVNVKIATDSWVADNRECISVIGNHSFFA